MLITNNNIELRNLQEQVLKNKEDIAKHYEIDRTLANFGIKIVGTVATVNDLPNPLTYDGEYGDGYAVGQPGSYTYYLFTRPDPNAGITENHWLDVGQLAIQGPQGPVGPQGPQGPRGDATRWYTSSTELANANPGDLWLDKQGNIFKKSTEANVWTPVTNIKGPQGIQGPRGPQGEVGPQGEKGERGETGDVGAFIHINGILSSSSQLPLPTQINDLSAAYLIGSSAPYTLWVQAGSSIQTAIWTDVGELNVGTYITVGGQFQNVWNADTKLDKNTSVTQYNQLYAKAANGGEGYINVTKQALGDAVVQRESDGSITVPYVPAAPVDATSREYVDNRLNTKLDLIEPVSEQKDFVTVIKTPNGYYQENMIATYTPEASYPQLVGVLRGMQGDIRGMVPANPHTYTLVNIEYLEQRLQQLKNELQNS